MKQKHEYLIRVDFTSSPTTWEQKTGTDGLSVLRYAKRNARGAKSIEVTRVGSPGVVASWEEKKW